MINTCGVERLRWGRSGGSAEGSAGLVRTTLAHILCVQRKLLRPSEIDSSPRGAIRREHLMDRRAFLKTATGLGLASQALPGLALLGDEGAAPAYFGLHPFIEAHPEAVFIRRTHVSARNDSEAKRREAFELARRIFTRRDSPGQSPSDKFAIKPNLTAVRGQRAEFCYHHGPLRCRGPHRWAASNGRQGREHLCSRCSECGPTRHWLSGNVPALRRALQRQ